MNKLGNRSFLANRPMQKAAKGSVQINQEKRCHKLSELIVTGQN